MSIKYMADIDMNALKVTHVGDAVADDDVPSKGQMDDGDTASRDRANHTGTQTAATISDFDTQVRTSRLDQMAAPTGPVSLGGQRATNGADPSTGTDLATKQYVDAQLVAQASGLTFKGAVRAVSTANVSTSSAPATIDGVSPTAGDVFLLIAQTTGSENGPWVWNGLAAAMTRPANWDTTAEAAPGSMWVVRQGTYDNQLAIMSNDTFTLGTTTATFVFVNPAAASDNDSSYTETCPATSAGAAWTVTHSLGSKNVHVTVYRTASPFDEVTVNVTHDSTTQINIRPDIALSSGEFTVYVSRIV